MKESKDPGGIQTHNGEGQVILRLQPLDDGSPANLSSNLCICNSEFWLFIEELDIGRPITVSEWLNEMYHTIHFFPLQIVTTWNCNPEPFPHWRDLHYSLLWREISRLFPVQRYPVWQVWQPSISMLVSLPLVYRLGCWTAWQHWRQLICPEPLWTGIGFFEVLKSFSLQYQVFIIFEYDKFLCIRIETVLKRTMYMQRGALNHW